MKKSLSKTTINNDKKSAIKPKAMSENLMNIPLGRLQLSCKKDLCTYFEVKPNLQLFFFLLFWFTFVQLYIHFHLTKV